MSSLKAGPFLLAHGGAGPQDPQGQQFASAQEKLKQLFRGTTLVPAEWTHPPLIQRWQNLSEIEHLAMNVVRELELEPAFNAGLGASLQSDGIARLSASYMESRRRKFSSVINVQDLIHPIDLAMWLQSERFSILDAFGAESLARELALKRSSPVTSQRIRTWIEHRRKSLQDQDSAGRSGTIGVVGVSKEKELIALTSTGGVGNETPGRVGDSPTIAGNFCSDMVATSCTGFGEQIIAHATAPRVALYYAAGKTLRDAVALTLQEAAARDFSFAFISVATRTNGEEFEWAAGSVNCQMVWGHGN